MLVVNMMRLVPDVTRKFIEQLIYNTTEFQIGAQLTRIERARPWAQFGKEIP